MNRYPRAQDERLIRIGGAVLGMVITGLWPRTAPHRGWPARVLLRRAVIGTLLGFGLKTAALRLEPKWEALQELERELGRPPTPREAAGAFKRP